MLAFLKLPWFFFNFSTRFFVINNAILILERLQLQKTAWFWIWLFFWNGTQSFLQNFLLYCTCNGNFTNIVDHFLKFCIKQDFCFQSLLFYFLVSFSIFFSSLLFAAHILSYIFTFSSLLYFCIHKWLNSHLLSIFLCILFPCIEYCRSKYNFAYILEFIWKNEIHTQMYRNNKMYSPRFPFMMAHSGVLCLALLKLLLQPMFTLPLLLSSGSLYTFSLFLFLLESGTPGAL